jgi:hypothetical protein
VQKMNSACSMGDLGVRRVRESRLQNYI